MIKFDKIKFYYLDHEHDPKIILIDNDIQECYAISTFDLTSIQKIKYPLQNEKTIINQSLNNGCDGSWDSIKLVLDDTKILEDFANSKNRNKFAKALNINTTNTTENSSIDLIERYHECFENQSTKIAQKYINIYNIGIEYIKNLNKDQYNNLVQETINLSNKEYFYLILENCNISISEITESHFSI